MIKYFHLFFFYALLQFGFGCSQPAIHVNLYELLDKPEAFHNRTIQLQGYLLVQEEYHRIYPTKIIRDIKFYSDIFSNSVSVGMIEIIGMSFQMERYSGQAVIEGVCICPQKGWHPRIVSVKILANLATEPEWFSEYNKLYQAICDIGANDKRTARSAYEFLVNHYGEKSGYKGYNQYDFYEALDIWNRNETDAAKVQWANTAMAEMKKYSAVHPNHPLVFSRPWFADQSDIAELNKLSYFRIEKHYFPDAVAAAQGLVSDSKENDSSR
jgi:hypothetical protein